MKKAFYYSYVGGLLLIPFVLIILPADFFDSGESVCLSVQLFDQTCYGCGMTRAIQHIIHLDFLTAYNFNKISFVVFPLLIVLWFGEIRRTSKKINTQKSKREDDML